MTWATLVSLLVKFGPQAFDLASKLIAKWSDTNPVTQADLDELRTLASQTPRSKMEAALLKAGIALDSEQGKALLALVS